MGLAIRYDCKNNGHILIYVLYNLLIPSCFLVYIGVFICGSLFYITSVKQKKICIFVKINFIILYTNIFFNCQQEPQNLEGNYVDPFKCVFIRSKCATLSHMKHENVYSVKQRFLHTNALNRSNLCKCGINIHSLYLFSCI